MNIDILLNITRKSLLLAQICLYNTDKCILIINNVIIYIVVFNIIPKCSLIINVNDITYNKGIASVENNKCLMYISNTLLNLKSVPSSSEYAKDKINKIICKSIYATNIGLLICDTRLNIVCIFKLMFIIHSLFDLWILIWRYRFLYPLIS